jgi:hypothetical protein
MQREVDVVLGRAVRLLREHLRFGSDAREMLIQNIEIPE